MTFGDVCAGIGGISLGLQRAGMTPAFQIENDPFCTKVLEKHWPDVPRWTDLKEVDPRALPRVDVLAGGIPCQPVSVAGKRKGRADERWLWPYFWEMALVLRPRYVLLENVPGILRNDCFGSILRDISASGFDAEWDCLPAAAVGAPHLRYRLFLVADPASAGRDERRGLGQGCATGASRWRRLGDSDCPGTLADIDLAGLEGHERGILADRESLARHFAGCRGGWAWCPPREDGPLESWLLRKVHGVSKWVDPDWRDRKERVKALGNAVVPQLVEWIGKRIVEAAVLREGASLEEGLG